MSETEKRFDKVLFIDDVAGMIGYSKSWMYKNMDKCPKPHRLKKNGKLRWYRSEVVSWMKGEQTDENM
jgi:predicted DNA-binding transcriptional regulator AlpA